MGYQGGRARSLWPRDNTTSDDLTLKTFTAILEKFWVGLIDCLIDNMYMYIKQILTISQPSL
jgi:hypothetical protein